MLIIILLPLLPIAFYIMRTKSPEEIRQHNAKTKKAAAGATAAFITGTAWAIRDGDK